MLKVSVLIFGSLLLFGCSDLNKSNQEVFPVEKASCLSSAIRGEYIVRWSDGTITKIFAKNDDQIKKNFLAKHKGLIQHVESNKMIYLNPSPYNSTAGLASDEIHFDNWAARSTKADVAWKQGFLGEGVVIAVIDSGVDYTHSQLKDQIAVNEGESGTDGFGVDRAHNGVDDDGNGLIDDYYGYNFGTVNGDPKDTGTHGTHVAGVIAAQHSDIEAGETKNYVQGIAPKAKILPSSFITAAGGGTLDAAIKAIHYAISRKVDLINASWGGASCSKTLGDEINSLEEKGILFVVASGNEGTDIDANPTFAYPAAYNLPIQLTVGAIAPSNVMTYFSNYGLKNVHVFAPGKSIVSTVPDEKYEMYDGTSMATPVVAGAVALLKSAKPNATAIELKNAILNGVDIDKYYRNSTHGRLNIESSLELLLQ